MDVSVSASKSEEELSREKQESTTPTTRILKSLEEPQRNIEPADGASHGTKDILVWWDIETCPIPSAMPSSDGAACLLQALQRHLTCDSTAVTINVYGNGGPGSKAGLNSLITSGITLQHRILPCKQPGSESAALKTMMVDIALWALTTPAPANVFLISAARDTSFRDLISGLHMRDYNIHLATQFNFGYETLQKVADLSQIRHFFKPMPRHWSVSKQLFVSQTAPSRLQSLRDANLPPNVQLHEKLNL